MGFRVDSLADLPENLRNQAAGKIINQQKPSKYHNIPTEVNGIKFDSRKEANRYKVLLAAQEAGQIHDLRLQHDFTLQEAYTTPSGERIRAIRYKADFTYRLSAGGYSLPFSVAPATMAEWFKATHQDGSNRLVIEDLHGDECHRNGPNSAHRNKETRQMLSEYGQRKWMKQTGGTIEDFIREFGRNYLDVD